MKQLKISPSITLRNDVIKEYLRELSGQRYQPVSQEEETRLFEQMQAGREEAREKLLNANLRFVISVAKQHQGKVPLPDLISAGNIGLCKAIERFDPCRGFRFISYAVWYIRQSIMYSLQEDAESIRVPQNVQADYARIHRHLARHYTSTGEDMSLEEACLELGITNLEGIVNALSSFKIINEQDENNGDFIMAIDADDYEDVENKRECLIEVIHRIIPHEKQANILIDSFGLQGVELDVPLLAQKYGLSTERIRQIKINAIRRLQNRAAENKEFKNLLLVLTESKY
ncbi:MAG: sigma-70 family RNA polymerase sigma factor [Paludibacteraceae bacterium]|nr:sigma-70 family RNA polymerase sigma factor [Paludibacteraceae bacterium]